MHQINKVKIVVLTIDAVCYTAQVCDAREDEERTESPSPKNYSNTILTV
jgi:hypothetical protein